MELGGIAVPSIEQFTGYGCIIIIALLVITRKLVWHKDLEIERKRTDRWEGIALRALGVAEKSTIQAEVTNTLVSRLPDPGAEEGEKS